MFVYGPMIFLNFGLTLQQWPYLKVNAKFKYIASLKNALLVLLMALKLKKSSVVLRVHQHVAKISELFRMAPMF